MKTIAFAVKIFALGMGIGMAFLPGAAQAAVTAGVAQFTAKLYTEGLGRIPDRTNWHQDMDYWKATACDAQHLQERAYKVLTLPEMTAPTVSNAERVFRLYRAALHRDPDAGGFTNYIGLLNNNVAWPTVVNGLLGSSEFISRASLNCGNEPSGWQATAPFSVTGNVIDGATLQTQLNQLAATGGIKSLPQGAIVKLQQSLVIPKNVMLTTTGQPGRRHAALLARLVRDGNFNAPLVSMSPGSQINSIWIDGQRNNFGYIHDGMNLRGEGSNLNFSNNILSDSPGWSTLQYLGSGEKIVCEKSYVGGNLLTAYGSSRKEVSRWTDGLSIACEDATVEYNEIIDPTDVSIVLFRATGVVQHSRVRSNETLNAGNSAWGGYVADPLKDGNGTLSHNFTGAVFDNNIIWSSPAVQVNAVLSVGTRLWFGGASDNGYGVAFTNNNTGTENVRGSIGIAVGRMSGVTVQGNALNFTQVTSRCPLGNVLVEPASVPGSSLQGYTAYPTNLPACMSL